jgi:hypothetical protein
MPLQLTNAMMNLFGDENFRSILESNCGDGVFLNSLASNGILRRSVPEIRPEPLRRNFHRHNAPDEVQRRS